MLPILFASIKNSRFSLLVFDSISVVKNAVIDEKRKATIFFRDERSVNKNKDE
jgi:hypothetical protein